jgi:UDP-N-acetylglucosamine--N-acetylmuramyl-(pentapeptide) pyrophosphoryl-undecaprenol N-acetylglucosamine transferase
MKVLLTGGGTGGHITPILAVAHELKQLAPDIKVIYVGERHGKFRALTQGHASIDASYSVLAGKFRRYHGEAWLARLLDIKTNILNLRDVFYVLFGIIQAWFLLGKIRPDIVFLKGGFVGVPIGLAAAARHIPIVTHDSDVLPGLANRLVSRWARLHATALPATYYPYLKSKVRPVGVLVEHAYQPVSKGMQAEYKQQLGLSPNAPLLLITGGSSGAERVNKAIVRIIDDLLKHQPDLQVIHQVGQGKASAYGTYVHPRLQVIEFMKPMYQYSGAADIIVTRAGATHLAEFGTQSKACIVVPNPYLTGGHQLKNANRLAEHDAALVITENDLSDEQNGLLTTIEKLLKDKNKQQLLAKNLRSLTPQDAARELAMILLGQAGL